MKNFFNIKGKFLFTVILFNSLFINNIVAQCSGCTINANNSTSAYTIVSGQTLCCSINYTGSITLKGGLVCNTGTIVNMTFLTGVFNNYNIYNQPGTLAIASTGTVNVHSFHGSSIKLDKINFAGAAGRPFNMYIYKGAKMDILNVVSQTTGSWNIEVGTSNPSGNPVVTSTLTAGGTITTDAGFTMNLLDRSTSTIADDTKLQGTGVKSITNYGTLTFTRDLTAISAGSSTSTVTITNYNLMTVRSFTADYSLGKVFVYNLNTFGNPIFTANQNVYLQKDITVVNSQSARFIVSQDITVMNGVVINCGSMTDNIMTVSGGTVTNNNSLTSNANFSVTSTSAVVNNNSYLNVIGTFNNLGVVNFGQKAILFTNDYNNLASTAYINGPSSVPDSTSYGKIIIKNNSNNTGNVTNKMMIDDQGMVSTSTNIGYGFDQVTSGSLITASVLFGSVGTSPGTGNPAIIQCGIKKNIYGVSLIDVTPNLSPACGQAVSFDNKIQTNIYVYSWPSNTQSTVPFTIPFATGTTFTWSPSGAFTNPNLQFETTTPVVNTTYTVLTSFVGCVYKQTTTITPVISITSSLVASATKCPNSLLVLNATGGGGTSPYTYSWTPTGGLTPGNTTSSATQTVTSNSNINYIATVKDIYGCAKSFTTLISVTSTSINPGMPLSYSVCYNNNLTITSSVSGGGGPSYTYLWTPGSTTASNLVLTGLTSSIVYQFQVTTPIPCVQIFPVNINVSPQILVNSPTTFYTNSSIPVQLGVTPIASGGTPPYTYAWTGPVSFVPGATAQNPYVTVASNSSFNLTVTDALSCPQAQAFAVNIISSPAYATLKKQVDAGFYQVLSNMLYFTIDGEYNGAAALNCKIYDIDHTVVSSPGSLVLKNGDNRYVVNLGSLGLSSTKLYTIEIVNEKNEVFLLKFKN